MKPTRSALLLITIALIGVSGTSPLESVRGNSTAAPSPYLFVWAGDEDRKDEDFLAVIDALPSRSTYGQLVATLPVGARATMPHHTEYEFPSGSMLFANGWAAGRTFIIDLSTPAKPRLAGQFTQLAGYGFPHSFARLPNGNLLGTFQSKGEGYTPPGALVELDGRGRAVRATSADVAGIDRTLIWPYSLLVLPEIDRVISTSTQMGMPKWASEDAHHGSAHAHSLIDTSHLQLWSLRDLRLLATIALPAKGKYHLNPAEPRRLADGSVYVNTFNCGLYRVKGFEGTEPKAEFVYSFPGGEVPGIECAVPVVVGKFWIQTDPSLPGLIALDVSNPVKPVEAARLVFDKRFSHTHWVAADRSSNRLVVTGSDDSWVVIVNIDPNSGRMAIDERFRDRGAANPGVEFNRARWPHGAAGRALVHGALFGPVAKDH